MLLLFFFLNASNSLCNVVMLSGTIAVISDENSIRHQVRVKLLFTAILKANKRYAASYRRMLHSSTNPFKTEIFCYVE